MRYKLFSWINIITRGLLLGLHKNIFAVRTMNST